MPTKQGFEMSDEMTCPTVSVKHAASPGGYYVINESDFDPAKHERHEPAVVVPPPPPLPPPPPAMSVKRGK
jgi:hypothetical protein